MKRDQFVRMTTLVLSQRGVPDAAGAAEAVAAQMDIVAQIMGEAALPPGPPAPSAAPPLPPFPAPNPQSVPATHPWDEAPQEVPQPPVVTDYIQQSPQPAPQVVLATSMSDVDRARNEVRPVDTPPIRSLRQPQTNKMTVQDLSLMVQDRTPDTLTFNAPFEGRWVQTTYRRNVIPMNAIDAVQLLYAPDGVDSLTAEAVQVHRNISLDELPVNLTDILQALQRQAAENLRPRTMHLAPVQEFSGVVTSPKDNTLDSRDVDRFNQVFRAQT